MCEKKKNINGYKSAHINIKVHMWRVANVPQTLWHHLDITARRKSVKLSADPSHPDSGECEGHMLSLRSWNYSVHAVQQFTVCSFVFNLCQTPAGSFLRGSHERLSRQHKVTCQTAGRTPKNRKEEPRTRTVIHGPITVSSYSNCVFPDVCVMCQLYCVF